MPTILERYQKTFAKDKELAQAANQLFPDGVTHDGAVICHRSRFILPVLMERKSGDLKTRRLLTIGQDTAHCYWVIIHLMLWKAVTTQMHRGTHYGACHPLELEWGNLVTQLIPSAERVRFVSSGTRGNTHGDSASAHIHAQE